MPLLIDTHVLIWIGYGTTIPDRVRQRLAEDVVFVSEVSRCEIIIKEQAKQRAFGIDFDRLIARAGYSPLALTNGVHRGLLSLPMIHRDPFDRLLVAQALHEELTLVTSDAIVKRYPVPTFW